MEKEYYLGLDMGTNSVGWAVTDDAYNLIRFKGKDMWGIREFDEANPAVERRTHRTSRRRKQRNAVRMGLIRSYFADEIQKVDSNFYQRLDNSFFHVEDKQDNVKDKNGIFNDKNYKDADYYKQYDRFGFYSCSRYLYGNYPLYFKKRFYFREQHGSDNRFCR